jgi:dihydroflavonol-4-reductase
MIFVTGGTGVLGSQLLFDLTQKGAKIRAIYRSEQKLDQTRDFFRHFNPDNWETQFNGISWVKGDILDLPLLEEQMTGCTHVYHCAAMVSFHKRDFHRMLQINRYGTANVVNVALDLKITKLCYVSSTAAIGGSDGKVITEKTEWKMEPTTTGYSISKYSAEKEVWRGIEEGLNAVMINPCVILGAGNWNDSSLTLFNTLKKGMKHYPPGSNATVDSRDVSSCMIQLMDSDISGERYLCTGSNQPFKVLMEEIAGALNVNAPKKPVKRWMVNLARRLVQFASHFTGKKPSITKETVEALFSDRSYDSSKLKKALNCELYGLSEMVEHGVKNRMS